MKPWLALAGMVLFLSVYLDARILGAGPTYLIPQWGQSVSKGFTSGPLIDAAATEYTGLIQMFQVANSGTGCSPPPSGSDPDFGINVVPDNGDPTIVLTGSCLIGVQAMHEDLLYLPALTFYYDEETPADGFARRINDYSSYPTLVVNNGVGEAAFSQLMGQPLTNLETSITRGAALESVIVPWQYWDQGESDYAESEATYLNDLCTLQSTVQAYAQGATGQSQGVGLILSQLATWGDGYSSNVALAEYTAALGPTGTCPNTYLLMPQYPFAVQFGYHLSNYAEEIIGEYMGRAVHWFDTTGVWPSPPHPISIVQSGATLTAVFSNPFGTNLTFDTTNVTEPTGSSGTGCLASGGACLGFELYGCGVGIAATPTLSIGSDGYLDVVNFVLSGTPVGTCWLAYANYPYDGLGPTAGPRGNLRDTNTDVSRLNNCNCTAAFTPWAQCNGPGTGTLPSPKSGAACDSSTGGVLSVMNMWMWAPTFYLQSDLGPTPTPSLTPNPTPTPIVSLSPSPTATSAVTRTPTPSPAAAPTPTPTATPAPSPTATTTAVPTLTPTPTSGLPISPTPTSTATSAATQTATPSPLSTPTATPAASLTSTSPPTGAPTPSAAATPSPAPTSAPANTPSPITASTATPTPIPPGGKLSLSTHTLVFGAIKMGKRHKLSFRIKNTKKKTTLYGDVDASELPPPLSVTAGAGAFALGHNKTYKVTVEAAPTARGAFSGTITIHSGDLKHLVVNAKAKGRGEK
jgi:hypothetical protein